MRIVPLAAVWGELDAQLTRSSRVQVITLLGYLEQHYPEQDWQPHYRTLQRRVKQCYQQRPLDSQPSEEESVIDRPDSTINY